MPQRGALPRIAPRQKQRAGGALAEAGGEQRGVSYLFGDDVLDLVGAEHKQRRVRLGVRLGQAQHDAVVARNRLRVHAGLLRHARAHRERPRRVDPAAERGVQHHTPIPQLVSEALEHQRLLVRDDSGGFVLFLQVGRKVPGGFVIQVHHLGGIGVHRTPELAQRLPQLVRPARLPTVPKRQPAGVPRRGRDDDLVARNIFNPPRGRTQGEHVAHPRFVDHLLVKLAHPARRALRAGQKDAEHAAIGDRPAGRDRHALRTGARGEHAAHAVVDHAGFQLRKIGRRVHAAG